MMSKKFIGKICNLSNDGNSFGYIKPIDTIDNHNGDISFKSSDLDSIHGISFMELSKGDIVRFETANITRGNGNPLIVARNIEFVIFGTIVETRINSSNQTFWGKIQPDQDNFLTTTNHIIFFENNFLELVPLEEVSINTKVAFIVQDYRSAINNIDKKARCIRIIDNSKAEIIIPENQISRDSDTPSKEKIVELHPEKFNSKLLKKNLLDLLKNLETITDHSEFEDLVFVLLRILGIHKLYQYERTNAAGRADGFFILANLSVIYDCTLKQDFSDYKADQIKNYIHQISKDVFTIVKSNKIEYSMKITQYRQVWIITNDVITKRKSRALKNYNDIWIKEVSVQSLIRLFAKKLSSSTFEEDTLADSLRMIDRL